jgi:hypothetical protein
MNRFDIRIALLGLGVLLGYGSAIAHWTHGHHHRWHERHDRCEERAKP